MKTNSERSEFAAIDSATGKELKLALQELWLTGRITPVGADLMVRHLFTCAETKPVEVVYAFGLPRDAALRRFRIVGAGFSAHSELRPTADAVKTYEAGIEAGSLSSLARQYRDGVVNLSVGNVRPGETVAVYLEIMAGVEMRDDSLRLRFPFALAPAYHAKARTIEAEHGVGEMELPEEFGDVLLPQWMANANGLHRIGFELTVALPQSVAEIGSPSHAVRVRNESNGKHVVRLAPEQDVPDRDLVLEVRTRDPLSGVVGGLGKDGTGHFALIVPSSTFGHTSGGPRRIVFVIDRSGSMNGAAMTQAKQSVVACLGALSRQDTFGVVAFDNAVECMDKNLLDGGAKSREAAKTFLDKVDARGGTELAAGFLAAATMLGKGGGDVLVLTDGQVSGTDTILASARSAGIRIHCLGIGSASQDRFLSLLARETGGVSRFLTARERVDMAAVELFAGISRPVAHEIRLAALESDGFTFTPEPPQAIFAGSPLLLYGESRGQASATIRLSWAGPEGKSSIDVPVKLAESADADTVRLLQGSRLITDMEAHLETVFEARPTGKRSANRQAKALEDLSVKYGLASRAMSLVAVVKRKGDKPGDVPNTRVVPVGMPQDTAFDAYFGSTTPPQPICCEAWSGGGDVKEMCISRTSSPSVLPELKADGMPATVSNVPMEKGDLLMALAGRIEPDGGMPGGDEAQRLAASIFAVLFFAENGHTPNSGAFREHVRRLIAYIDGSSSIQTLLDLPKAVNESGHRMHDIVLRLRSSGGILLTRELAEVSEICCQSFVQFQDTLERQSKAIQTLLLRLRRGETIQGNHTAIVQKILQDGYIGIQDLWREIVKGV